MSRYHRENPDQPIQHDWLGGIRSTANQIPEPNVASTQSLKSCWFSDEKCPKCGSYLISNGKNLWCSFIGGENVKACDYGIKVRVSLPDPVPVPPDQLAAADIYDDLDADTDE